MSFSLLGASWEPLGGPLGAALSLRGFFGCLGAILGRLGSILGRLGNISGHLGLSRGHLSRLAGVRGELMRIVYADSKRILRGNLRGACAELRKSALGLGVLDLRGADAALTWAYAEFSLRELSQSFRGHTRSLSGERIRGAYAEFILRELTRTYAGY